MRKLTKKYFIFLIQFPIILILDQWTKYLIVSNFKLGESINIIDYFFNLTYVRNRGAAFGMLSNLSPNFRDPLFIFIPIIVLIIIGIIFIRIKPHQVLIAVSLTLIMGGAIGNLIDRLKYGYVVDFLDFHWKATYHWPAFNVADSCIVIGVGFMFIESLLEGKQSTNNSLDKPLG